MSLRLVFIMDPIDRIDIDGDSTFAIMLDAQLRGHQVLYCEMRDLSLVLDQPWARVRPVQLRRERGNHYTFGDAAELNLNEVDAVFMRKDPPIESEYFATTHLLSFVDQKRVLLVNDPQSLRDCNEKLFALEFAQFLPRTIVARSMDRLRRFIDEVGKAVIKPLNAAGGEGILFLEKGDRNTSSVLEMMTDHERVAVIMQEFIEAVREGDRRIILFDGEAVGVINRRPQGNDFRSNMHAGGKPEPAKLTARDHEICNVVGPVLRERGLMFVGIDVIGGFLTEINVTSPTGIQEINRFDGACIESILLEHVERRCSELG